MNSETKNPALICVGFGKELGKDGEATPYWKTKDGIKCEKCRYPAEEEKR